MQVRSADERPLPLQVDGDYIGDVSQAHFSAIPQSLLIVA
jgi:diacylglycerol kinase family enzyme